ncbi:hypothetical protein MSBR3_3264 [Methanosarcina barkeri 3]|uniref:Uncharacterized protein n=1 Tax=Methanosarcina barkeri 3 TaxID=1434107 RepID=A0A0E3SPU7_METBA|nr:hypothetical protein MSBR3_3264 [Methanosarcina barkeri 3]
MFKSAIQNCEIQMGISVIQDKYSVGFETLNEFSDNIVTIVFAAFVFSAYFIYFGFVLIFLIFNSLFWLSAHA